MKSLTLLFSLLFASTLSHAGYYLKEDQMAMFSEGKVSAAQYVNRDRAVSAIRNYLIRTNYINLTPSLSANSEAVSIYESASTVGIDPMFLTVMLKANFLQLNRITKTTKRYPVTLSMLREIQDQYGIKGKRSHSDGMDVLMKAQLKKRFTRSIQNEFLAALRARNPMAKNKIQNNPDFAIFAVAQYLKVLISRDSLRAISGPRVSYAAQVKNPQSRPSRLATVSANKRDEMNQILKALAPLDKGISTSELNGIIRLYSEAL